MPIPKPVTRFNHAVTNRISRHVAGWLPPFAIVHHVGRTSGRRYSTPIMAFRDGEHIVVALTYGPDTDWVRNVLAAGSCTITHRGRTQSGLVPELITADPATMPLPGLVRAALRLLRVDQFLLLRPRSAPAGGSEPTPGT